MQKIKKNYRTRAKLPAGKGTKRTKLPRVARNLLEEMEDHGYKIGAPHQSKFPSRQAEMVPHDMSKWTGKQIWTKVTQDSGKGRSGVLVLNVSNKGRFISDSPRLLIPGKR